MISLKLGIGMISCTSAKCKNNYYLFKAFLPLDAVFQNVEAFFKLISFTNAVIYHSRIRKFHL